METLNIEYKELYLNSVPFTNTECRRFIKHGFTNEYYTYCLERFTSQFIKVIPKYASAYNNSRINGKIIFGIRDNGNKIGIPFINELEIEVYIKSLLTECEKYVTDNEILRNITVSIEKLEKRNNKKNEIIKKINKMNTIIGIEECKYNSYITKMDKIKKELSKYRCKISNILKNKSLRNGLIKYINKTCRISRIRKLMKKSMNDTIDYSSENIKNTKLNKKNIMYWLTTYRDIKTDMCVKKLNKIKNNNKIRDTVYIDICKNMEYVREFSNVNFYIITCEVKYVLNNNILCLTEKNEWIHPLRYLDIHGNPKTEKLM